MDALRLSEFIRETISEVAFGVHLAKADTHQIVAVSPGSLNGDNLLEKSYIEFDIAITATSENMVAHSKSGKAGAGISVLSAKVGLDGNLERSTLGRDEGVSSSRIAFKVPVYFNAQFRGTAGIKEEAAFVMALNAERVSI